MPEALTSRFDVVICADEAHSAVRALAFGPESDFVTHLDSQPRHTPDAPGRPRCGLVEYSFGDIRWERP